MKLLLCILGIALITGQVYCHEGWKEKAAECKKELEITEEKLDKSDPKFKCFLACMLEKFGVLVGDKLDEDKFVQMKLKMYSDVTDAEAKIKECAVKGNAESDKCEVVAVAKDCVREQLGAPNWKGKKDDDKNE
uniref:Odorant-binding protein 19 n=1 Tax=Encarsia formosa TaxID=32400 RepID=A0A514TTX5_ENCFO|nr:odorant-binding protein 19 [Encarsia formosa]